MLLALSDGPYGIAAATERFDECVITVYLDHYKRDQRLDNDDDFPVGIPV